MVFARRYVRRNPSNRLINKAELLVLPRRDDAFLLPLAHTVRADFWVQVDVDFILIKHDVPSAPGSAPAQ